MSKEEKLTPSIGSIAAKILVGIAFVVIVAATVWKWQEIWAVVGSKEAIKAWLTSLGVWAPLAFIIFQFLQVVVFIIPGEVAQIAGGYFFGIGPGLLYSVVGIGLGSGFAFLTARLLGLSFVTRLFGKEQIAKFEGFISSPRAQVAFFLLFLIPGIPKDILCYIAGISYLSLGSFMAISMVARLPALLGSIIFGNAAAEGNYLVLIIIGVVASVLFLLGLIFRSHIHDWISQIMHRKDK